MRLKYSAIFIVITIFVVSIFALAQETKIYTDPVDRYQVQLSGDWREVSSTEGNGQRRLVIVYQGHSDRGELRVRKVESGGLILDQLLKKEEESSLRYLPGFAKVKNQEVFGGGGFSGKMIEFDFKRYNNAKLARYYYIDDAKGNFWILMFSGETRFIKNVRPDTDKMARSFKPLE